MEKEPKFLEKPLKKKEFDKWAEILVDYPIDLDQRIPNEPYKKENIRGLFWAFLQGIIKGEFIMLNRIDEMMVKEPKHEEKEDKYIVLDKEGNIKDIQKE